ncbi:MAG: hypothetical protein AAFQ79_18115 [Pseudomonadota bacterium]
MLAKPIKSRIRNTIRGAIRRAVSPHFSLGDDRIIDRCDFLFGDIPENHRTIGIGPFIEPANGGRPENAAALQRNFIALQSYARDRPARQQYSDVTYGPNGYALHNGRIDYSLSARKKVYNRDFSKLLFGRPAKTLEAATLIESHFPNTYGDWVFETLRTLTQALPLNAPLLLPQDIGSRSYVRNELAELGVEFVVATEPVRIRRAEVLHKPRCLNQWDERDVCAYRKAFGIEEIKPTPGSMIYLSREGVVGAHGYVTRNYKSSEVSAAVESKGGRTILTESMGMHAFRELAPEAETVIADHGAAIFNVLQWRPKRVIEIVTNNWWDSSTFVVSRATGVEMHGLLVCDGLNAEDIDTKLTAFLKHTP